MNKKLFIVLLLSLFAACNGDKDKTTSSVTNTPETDNTPPLINYSVVNAFPHDTSAYTEGFLVHDGQLYESTGYEDGMPENRRSLFGTVNMKNGKIEVKAEIDKKKYFGEGIVFLNNKVYQLTYKTKIGFVYDAKTFKKIGEFTFPSQEGWGMTTDGKYIIMSDGSSNISFLDPASSTPTAVTIHYSDDDSIIKTLNNFRLIRVLGVTDNNGSLAISMNWN